MHPMLISHGLILGFAYRVPKPLMHFQSHGQERTIGWFLQYVIQHLLVCTAVGTLVVPYWPSNAFWPFLFTSSVEYQAYVIESIYLPDPSGIFAVGCYKDSLIGSDKFNSAVLAVSIDARGLWYIVFLRRVALL